jgi:hypothetical protein
MCIGVQCSFDDIKHIRGCICSYNYTALINERKLFPFGCLFSFSEPFSSYSTLATFYANEDEIKPLWWKTKTANHLHNVPCWKN